MSNCQSFVKTWKVLRVDSHFEKSEHKIAIRRLADGQFKVECKDDPGHAYSNATCSNGSLKAVDGSYTIHLTPGDSSTIDFGSGVPAGSWTADDNIGTGGEG